MTTDDKFILTNESAFINRNLIFADRDLIAKKVIRENFLVEKAIVEKIWPSTLNIKVRLYNPDASLVVNNGYFVLSSDGRILGKKKDNKQSLPIINYYQKLNSSSYQTGDWIDFEDITRALYFIDQLKQINLIPLTIDIKGQDMLVFSFKDNRQIFLSYSKSKELQDYQLKLIIKQFKIEGKDFKKIDLRFDKPVIQF